MNIHSKIKDYHVNIEDNLDFLEKFAACGNVQFVIDEKVYHLYERHFKDYDARRLILVKAVEENKTIETALQICEAMTEMPAKRNARLISVGGGVIQDITGFAANVLYRGIRWTFVPTTLLASCDSCIGGKTSLNYGRFKNLLGTFYPPDEIYICPELFHTLSEQDFQSGLGEVIKFNLMAGEEGLENIEANILPLLNRDAACLERFVRSSLAFKKPFIEADEFDRGERVKLNFAHTFGHAIETITSFQIPHGTAVAIGMIMANHISCRRGLLDPQFAGRCEKVLLQVIHPVVDLMQFSPDEFLSAMRKDKKQTSTQLTAVFMTKEEEKLRIVHDVQEQEVREAFFYFGKLFAENGPAVSSGGGRA